MEQLEIGVWTAINMIEDATKKDGLKDMSREDLERLIIEVRDFLGAIVM